jgi:hypothetical protein
VTTTVANKDSEAETPKPKVLRNPYNIEKKPPAPPKGKVKKRM